MEIGEMIWWVSLEISSLSEWMMKRVFFASRRASILMEWDPKRRQQEAGIMDQRVSLDFPFSTL